MILSGFRQVRRCVQALRTQFAPLPQQLDGEVHQQHRTARSFLDFYAVEPRARVEDVNRLRICPWKTYLFQREKRSRIRLDFVSTTGFRRLRAGDAVGQVLPEHDTRQEWRCDRRAFLGKVLRCRILRGSGSSRIFPVSTGMRAMVLATLILQSLRLPLPKSYEEPLSVGEDDIALAQLRAEEPFASLLGVESGLERQLLVEWRDRPVVHVQVCGA
jgi:hypothetical protein